MVLSAMMHVSMCMVNWADYSLKANDINDCPSNKQIVRDNELGKQVYLSFTGVRGCQHSAMLHHLLSGRHTKLNHSVLAGETPAGGRSALSVTDN